jgi:hypothetical protein
MSTVETILALPVILFLVLGLASLIVRGRKR